MPKPLLITYEGRTFSRQEWAALLGISEGTIAWRQRCGMAPADILSRTSLRGRKSIFKQKPSSNGNDPDRPRLALRRTLTFHGQTKSIAQWALELNLSENVILGRLYRRWTIEDVFRPLKVKGDAPRGTRKTITRKSLLTFMDETMSIEAWALDLEIPVPRILYRLKAGEPIERCLAKERPAWPSTPARLSRGGPVMRVPPAVDIEAMLRAA